MAVNSVPMARRKAGRKAASTVLRTVAKYAAYWLASAIFVMPFIWALSGSLKTGYQLEEFPPRFLPDPVQWKNYAEIWTIVPLARYFWNTIVVTVLSLIGTTITAALVAYGFARFRFPGRDKLFLLVLSTMMLPQQVTLIPQFIMFFRLHWVDTYLPLIVPSYFGGGAFAIFLFRQFFRTVPLELDEAAKIDGASYPRIFFQILLPVSTPVLIAMTIRGFLAQWNNFLAPLIYLNSQEKLTISVGLRILAQTASQQANLSGEPTTHLLMAASIVATIPPVLLYAFTQRQLVEGITLTGIKG